jgi:hypothetical protein
MRAHQPIRVRAGEEESDETKKKKRQRRVVEL